MAFDDARANVVGGFGVLNYHGPRFYEENVPSWDPASAMLKGIRRRNGEPAYFSGAPVLRECTKCDKIPEQLHEPLKACAGCRKVMYCSRDCQKKDWATHKKFCKIFAAMPEPPSAASLDKTPMCVPGYDPIAAGNGNASAPASKSADYATTTKPKGSDGTSYVGSGVGRGAGFDAGAGTGNRPQCSTQ